MIATTRSPSPRRLRTNDSTWRRASAAVIPCRSRRPSIVYAPRRRRRTSRGATSTRRPSMRSPSSTTSKRAPSATSICKAVRASASGSFAGTIFRGSIFSEESGTRDARCSSSDRTPAMKMANVSASVAPTMASCSAGRTGGFSRISSRFSDGFSFRAVFTASLANGRKKGSAVGAGFAFFFLVSARCGRDLVPMGQNFTREGA